MDNTGETVFFVERIEASPYNEENIYDMNFFKIMSILNNPEYQANCQHIEDKYFIQDNDGVHEINRSVNYRFDKKKTFVLKNEDVHNYFQFNGRRCDYAIIQTQTLLPLHIFNYFLINHYDKKIETNYFITILSINTTLIPESFYQTFSNKDIQHTQINGFFIQFLLTMMKYHFDEINNLRNKTCENKEILRRINHSTENYLCQRMIDQPSFLDTPLFQYQRANLHWMIQKELFQDNFVIDNAMTINWGTSLEFDFNTLSFNKRKRIDQYPADVINYFTGGCLCDDVGLGKTLQVLTLCLMNPSRNLIIVPNHLVKHWFDEFKKHFPRIHPEHIKLYSPGLTPHDNQILIASFDIYQRNKSSISQIQWTRVIVDEFHEIYTNLDLFKTSYKWISTATPFINSDMILNIMNFVAKNKITDVRVQKYKKYLDIFESMFRRNTKNSIIREVSMPPIQELIYYLNFSQKEKLFYDSINDTTKNYDIVSKLQFCVNPNIYFLEKNGSTSKGSQFISINYLDDGIRNIQREYYQQILNNIYKIKQDLISKIKPEVRQFVLDNSQIDVLWEHNKIILEKQPEFIINITQLQQQLDFAQKKMIYFEQQLKVINDLQNMSISETKTSTTHLEHKEYKETLTSEEMLERPAYPLASSDEFQEVEEETCLYCLDEITKDFSLFECGHMFHSECVAQILKQGVPKCPSCMITLKNTTIFQKRIDAPKSDMDNDINKYGTKISNLIKIIKTKFNKQKVIVYCHSPSLLFNLTQILINNDIKTSTFADIDKFEFNDSNILVLSSENNASGLHLTYINTIILLQSIGGDYMYRKQIENQMIGRSHRIGQNKEVTFIRLIINNTIEQQMQIENYVCQDILSLKTTVSEIHV